ncbi:hypothetical protein FACS189468_3560 [Spirochaetia bacterium]|nr:hypothetical protein FACS189468_3560 [Spirochaetia bacterium]
MKRIGIILPLAALFLCSCTTAPFYAGERRYISEGYFGMAPGSPLEEPKIELMDKLGVTWIRRTLYWSSMEHEPDQWDFIHWDEFVEAGKGAGKKILAILAYDNDLYLEKGQRDDNITPEILPYYLRYVENVVRRYKGRIDAYEIWNEPNLAYWNGSRRDYCEMVKAAARKIREIDPGAVIVAGAFWRTGQSWVRDMFEAGAMADIDVISFHPYAVNPRGVVKLYDRLKKRVSTLGYTGEIWVTEVGYPTHGWYPHTVSERKYPQYIVKTLTGLAVRGVRTCFWYELFDANNRDVRRSLNSEEYFGLAYPDYSLKPGAAAYALCGTLIAGTEYRPDLPQRTKLPPSVESLCFTGAQGRHVLFLWSEGKTPLKVVLTLPGTEQRLCDIVSGEEKNVGEETELLIDGTPRIFTWVAAEDAVPHVWRRP